MHFRLALLALALLICVKSAVTAPSPVIPPKLTKGDVIGVICPAYSVINDGMNWTKNSFIEHVEQGMAHIGLKVKWGKYVWNHFGYLAGTDEERTSDLMAMFVDKSVKAILACRGGWGDARIVDKYDYSVIRANPKPIIGFSDLTATINAIQVQTGLITFHGPMGIELWSGANLEYLSQVLFGLKTSFVTQRSGITTFKSGKARGRLVGGNLSVFVALIGSPFVPSASELTKDSILFLEDTGEYSYSVDRMLTHLHLAGYLDAVAGVVWGTCSGCEAQYPNDFTVAQILHQHFDGLSVPVFSGAMFGHIEQQFTLPLGTLVEIDADQGTITMLEPATA